MGGVLFAVFAAALGYGTLLPLVPVYLGAGDGGDVAWHSGALPAVFLVAASVFAPLWGHVSDRVGRRAVIGAGAAGGALALVPFFLEHGMAPLYAYQALAGAAFGAVLPAGLAFLYETGDPPSRPRRIAWFGTALLGGYLVGPALGGALAGLAEGTAALAPHEVVQLVLGIQAALAALAAAIVWRSTASQAIARGEARGMPGPKRAGAAVAPLVAAMLVAFLLGGFETGTTLHLRGPLGFDSRQVAALFIACSAAMAVSQLAFLPRVPARVSRVAGALALVAASAVLLAAMPAARTYVATLSLGAPIGAGLGLAFGLAGLEMAEAAGVRRGFALGVQNAAIATGQAAGSLLGGVLFASLREAALAGFGVAVIVLALSFAGLIQVNKGILQRSKV